MAIQAINDRSLRLYREVVSAIETIRFVLEDGDRLVELYEPSLTDVEGIKWTVPTEDEMRAHFKRAAEGLVSFRTDLLAREKELTSRQWR